MRTIHAFFVLALCVSVCYVNTCGITTHTEIGHRAIRYLEAMGSDKFDVDYLAIIKKHPAAYTAGAPYPDTFYNGMCQKGKYHDVAEDTHWVPFMVAAVKYVQAMPKPLSEHNEKVVAFLFGVATHSMADISWHGLGVNLGFLHAMGRTDFHGVWENAHGVGDFGGDVVATYEYDLGWMKALDWYVPADDIKNIYDLFYGADSNPITSTMIKECTALMYAGRIGEKLAVNKAYPTYGEKSPFLLEQYQDYPIGGVDDMAIWSAKYYNVVMKMFEGKCPLDQPRNPVDIDASCKDVQSIVEQMTGKRLSGFPPHQDVFSQSSSHVVAEDVSDGAVVFRDDKTVTDRRATENAMEETFGGVVSGTEQTSWARSLKGWFNTKAPTGQFVSKIDHARLGASFAAGDFNNDGIADYAVGAPAANGAAASGKSQAGRVYLMYGRQGEKYGSKVDIESRADLILEGEQYFRLGTALATVDLNGDGIADLAVSAPTVDGLTLQYTGQVHVYLGSKDGLAKTPALVLTTSETYHNMGWKLTSGDLDNDGHNDLVIGSQFHMGPAGEMSGQVAVLLSSSTLPRTGTVELSQAADWTKGGDMMFSWYGSHVSVEKAGDRTLLLVGAVAQRQCAQASCPYNDDDVQSVGKLHAYEYDAASKGLKDAFSITGAAAFDKLGHDASIGAPFGKEKGYYLAVSAPTKTVEHKFMWVVSATMHQAGQVALIPLSSLSGDMKYSDLKPELTLNGDRHQGRLGWALTFADVNSDGVDDLIVTSPVRTYDPTSVLFTVTSGRVYLWYGGAKFPTGLVDSATDSCHVEMHSDAYRDRFGTILTIADVNGDNKNEVIVGAPASGKGALGSGSVEMFQF